LISFLVWLIDLLARGILVLIFANVLISYFLDPYHPLRRNLSRFVEPLLAPIRRILPPVGMFDFSPFVLIILVQVAGQILIRLLLALG
jgi:YggT family protein